MMNDEHLELDEVTGDFCDWFAERIHHLCVRQSNKHYEFHRMYHTMMKSSFDNEVEKLFGHKRSFYGK